MTSLAPLPARHFGRLSPLIGVTLLMTLKNPVIVWIRLLVRTVPPNQSGTIAVMLHIEVRANAPLLGNIYTSIKAATSYGTDTGL